MDPNDFFKGFFGFPRHRNNLRFQQPPEHEDESPHGCPHHPHVEVFTNPLEMERFFSHQMEDLMKGFFGANQFFDQRRSLGINDREEIEEEEGDNGSRDFMLKNGGLGYVEQQDDKWEDGEVSPNDLKQLDPSQQQPQHHMQPHRGFFGSIFSADPFFHGHGGPNNGQWQSLSHSSSTTIVTLPDGTREERRVVTDSQGNTTETVTRTKSDKSETTTTIMDGNQGHRELEEPRNEMLNKEHDTNQSLFRKFFGNWRNQ